MAAELFTNTAVSWPMIVAVLWAALAAPFLVVWFFFWSDKSKTGKYKLPPGPPTYPIVGNINVLVDTSKPTHQIVDDLSKTYGGLLLLKVGIQNLMFVSDPGITMEFLKQQDHLFSFRPDSLHAGRYLLYGESHITLGQPGEYHSFLRKLFVTELLSNKKLNAFRDLRTSEQSSIIRAAYIASKNKEEIDVRELFNTLTLNVITKMAFGKKFFGHEVEIGENEKSHLQWVNIVPEMTTRFTQILAESIHPSLYWVDTLTGVRRGMISCHKRLDALCQEFVDEHKKKFDEMTPQELKEFEPTDFMDIMLMMRGGENGKHISDKNLKAVSMDLIVAGSDTSATIMEWAMSELIAHPDIMKRVREEIDSVVGFDRTVEESDAPYLPFLAAVVKETFRLHPPLPWLLPHSCRVDGKVGGYDIPKGSFINFNVWGMSRNPKMWRDPLTFDPDRFYNKGDATDVEMKGTHPQLLPFGTGRRICPGVYMTAAIVNPTLARMLHSFEWSLATEDDAKNIDMSERSGAIAAKSISLKAFPTPRLPAHLYK